jgi:hypothetical protein
MTSEQTVNTPNVQISSKDRKEKLFMSRKKRKGNSTGGLNKKKCK